MREEIDYNLVLEDNRTAMDVILDGVASGKLTKYDAKKLLEAIYEIKDL